MSRRICLACITALIALGAPAAGLAQTSSQAQYQGVAPETQTPVGGAGNGGAGGAGSAGGNATGGGGSTTSSGGSASGGTSGASGNGGALSGVPAAGGAKSNPAIPAPSASSDTTLFS